MDMDRGVSTCSVPATLTKHGLGVKDVVFICINLNEETLERSEMNKSGGNETLHRSLFILFELCDYITHSDFNKYLLGPVM